MLAGSIWLVQLSTGVLQQGVARPGPRAAGAKGTVVPTASFIGQRGVVQSPLLDQWRDYEELRGGLDEQKYRDFFSTRPQRVVGRLYEVASTLRAAKKDWEESEEGLAAGEKSDEFDPTKDVRDEAPVGGRGQRLCEAMSSLGPVSVKIAQTLSQRPDLVGDEAATALKRLQTSNVPYDDALAWAVVKEEFGWRGPIAPGVGLSDSDEPGAAPLFATITPDPIAVASLGQVYKATTHEGREVAVKVQRPDAMATLGRDYLCFLLSWGLLETLWKIRGGFDNGDVLSVVNRVAADILDELDYEKEAENAVRFEDSLAFLGFVGVPLVVKEYSTKKVLVTEWVQGQHLSALPEAEGLKMTRMAVEACTASLVLTGYVHARGMHILTMHILTRYMHILTRYVHILTRYVHADPHEGDLYLLTYLLTSSGTCTLTPTRVTCTYLLTYLLTSSGTCTLTPTRAT